ncbi:hypothetical protein K474DRAFT_1707669 [Panus rudis PR-1116 ss-1]|nr:hypothetical protein K474DRAFT_1707669 [Panus rudis PR-1116 ss-1]
MKTTHAPLLTTLDNVATNAKDCQCSGDRTGDKSSNKIDACDSLEVPRLYRIINVSMPLYWSKVPTWVEHYLEPPQAYVYTATESSSPSVAKRTIENMKDIPRAFTGDLASDEDEYVPFDYNEHNHSGPSYTRSCCKYPKPIQRPQGGSQISTTKTDALQV